MGKFEKLGQMKDRVKDWGSQQIDKAQVGLASSETWNKIKTADAFGMRWIAAHRVEGLGTKIDNAKTKRDAMQLQLNSPGTRDTDKAKLLGEQNHLTGKIEKWGARRSGYAGTLERSRKYGEKLREPLRVGTMRQTLTVKDGEKQALDGKLTAARQTRDNLIADFQKLSEGYVSPTKRSALVQQMAVLTEEITGLETDIRAVDRVIKATNNRVDKWEAQHGEAARWAARNSEIAKDGLHGTNARNKFEAPNAKVGGGNVANFEDEAAKRGKTIRPRPGTGPDDATLRQGSRGLDDDAYHELMAKRMEGQREGVGVEEALKQMMKERFGNEQNVVKPFEVRNLVDVWNTMVSKKLQIPEVSDHDAKLFSKNKPEMTLVDFGVLVLAKTKNITSLQILAGIADMATAKQREAARGKRGLEGGEAA